jgi:hypothetical protein
LANISLAKTLVEADLRLRSFRSSSEPEKEDVGSGELGDAGLGPKNKGAGSSPVLRCERDGAARKSIKEHSDWSA